MYLARGPDGLETGVTGSINTEIIERAGGRNVADGGDQRRGIASVSPEQVLLWNPDVLITIGQPSTGALLGVQGITKNRGRWFSYQTGTREIRAMPMLHPAYLLRTPIAKRLAWRDMLAIKKALG